MERFKNVIKFPTKAQRRSYRKKLFSLKTTVEVVVVTMGVLLAEFVLWIVKGLK